MTDKPEGLECDHCGDVAIEFNPPRHPGGRWLLFDGDGGACMTCGFHGHVAVDDNEYAEDAIAEWTSGGAGEDEKCKRPNCEECAPPACTAEHPCAICSGGGESCR